MRDAGMEVIYTGLHQTIEEIVSSGLPLGILAAATYSQSAARLEPGDLLVLFTDGLTEAEDAEEEEFGVERLTKVVAALEEPTAERACEDILRAIDRYTGQTANECFQKFQAYLCATGR